jgi:hypothetical protein
MRLTDRARDRLDGYLDEVRRAAEARGDVDVDDVVAGVREHIDAELSERDASGPAAPVTAEELDEVLERLGMPGRWEDGLGGDGAPGRGAETAHAGPARDARLALAGALGLGLVGILLASFERPAPGVALLATGALVARIALAVPAGTPSDTGALALRLYWTLAALVAGLVVLTAPAVAVWSSAQIGGFLDGWANPGAPPIPGTRDPAYWRWIAGLMGASTAVWWTLLGLAGLRWRPLANRLLGPALVHLSGSSMRVLAGSGLLLVLPSLWLLLT